MFHTPKMPQTKNPVQVDYSQVSQAYFNQLGATSRAAGMGSTNPTGGQGALTGPSIASKTLVGE